MTSKPTFSAAANASEPTIGGEHAPAVSAGAPDNPLQDRRRTPSDNPLRDVLARLGQAHLEEAIVRAVGAHLVRQHDEKSMPTTNPDEQSRDEDRLPSKATNLDMAVRTAAMQAGALRLPEAAARVGASERDYELRVDAGTLLALQRGNDGWVLPAFQFCESGHLVPGLSQVLSAISEGTSFVLIEAFFMTPQAALENEGGLPTSPRDWLCGRRELGPVLELARYV